MTRPYEKTPEGNIRNSKHRRRIGILIKYENKSGCPAFGRIVWTNEKDEQTEYRKI